MRVWSLGEIESHFVEIVWAHQPVSTRELIALCEKELNWKRTTTYTVLKKMCDRGLFTLENGVVSQRSRGRNFLLAKVSSLWRRPLGDRYSLLSWLLPRVRP